MTSYPGVTHGLSIPLPVRLSGLTAEQERKGYRCR